MTQPIAKIKLAPGNVGWYDSLTNIVLTKAKPEAVVYSGKNIINIKKAIREGKVLLQEGSLSSYQNKATEEKERDVEKDIPKKEEKQKEQKNIYKIISSKNNSNTKKENDKKSVTNNTKPKKEENAVELLMDSTKESSNSTKKE